MEFDGEDNDGLSQQACTALAASAGRHASAERHHVHISQSLCPDVLQQFQHAANCIRPSSARKTKQSYSSRHAM